MPMTAPGECSAHVINDVPEIAPKSDPRFQDPVIGREPIIAIRVFKVACAVANGSNPADPCKAMGVSIAGSAVIGPIEAVSIVSGDGALPVGMAGRIAGMGAAYEERSMNGCFSTRPSGAVCTARASRALLRGAE